MKRIQRGWALCGLMTAACQAEQYGQPEASVACEDVERVLIERVRSAIGAGGLSDVPLDELQLRVWDDADLRYVAVEVRAPSGSLLATYRIERATGALSTP